MAGYSADRISVRAKFLAFVEQGRVECLGDRIDHAVAEIQPGRAAAEAGVCLASDRQMPFGPVDEADHTMIE